MNVYVVNLKRRPDRRERMERILPSQWHVRYTTYWPGPLDGQRLDPEALWDFDLFPWQIGSDNPWWDRPLKLGEIGCAVSHLTCWRKAVEDRADTALVFEDDAVLVDGIVRKLSESLAALEALDPTWDLLYLGRWALEEGEPVAPGFVRPRYSYCSFAYMLSASGLRKVLESGFERALIPVDEFLPALYMDHPRLDVRLRYPKCLNAYALDPPLVTQLPKEEAGSDTEASAFVREVATVGALQR